MKIRDLVNEGPFQQYRQLGQHPTQLVGHLAKKALGIGSGTGDSKPVPPTPKSKLGDTTEIKNIIDQVLAGKQLDSQSLQALKTFRRKL